MSVLSRRVHDQLLHLRRKEDGVSAVEFGLIAIPFFLLVMALMEIGLLFFGTLTLENAVEQASRLIRTGQAQSSGLSAAGFKDKVCSHIPALIDCSGGLKVDVKRFDNFTSVAGNLPEPLDDDGNLRDDFGFQPGSAGDIVVVRVFYEWDMFSVFSNFFSTYATGYSGLSNMDNGSRLLIATSAFRNEPFN